MNEEALEIRSFEPLFVGNVYIPMRYIPERVEIYDKFGPDGGFLIDYACGIVSFKQYLMKCEVQGNDDYNIDLLVAIAAYYQEYATKFMTFMQTNPYYRKPDIMCKFEMFKKRLFQFKYEISQLNLKGIDNL